MSPTSFQTAPSRDKCYLLKRRMGRGGFEPPKQVAADLQSVPFGHSGICPFITKQYKIDLLHSSITWIVKADDRTRTDNLLITNQLLCQLSHIGIRLMTFNSAHCCAKNDSNGIWTRVTAVKGRCLNRLTMEPKKKKTPRVGLEPTTTRLTAECSTIELSRIIKVCTFKTSYKSDLFFSVINQIKPSTY